MLKRRMSVSFGEPETKKMKWNMECCEYGMVCNIGERKENQDAVVATEAPFNVFAVFDGHGQFGKLASGRAKYHIQKLLSQFSIPETKDAAEAIIRFLLITIDEELVSIGKVNDTDFGTTATVAIPYGKDELKGVVIGNVGDSDALVIKSDGTWSALDSSHRVIGNETEQKRIEAEGGAIWKSRAIPATKYTFKEIREKKLALAVSRALGHCILKDYGISATPEFKDIPIVQGDFLVIASDGIWDALKSKSVAELVTSNDASLNDLCEKICEDSLSSWRKKQTLADNMAIVIAQF